MQGEPDDVLLAPVSRALRSKAPRVLVVVHLMGSHWRYSERYRSSDEHFKPAYKGVSFPSVGDTVALRNSYRNTIRVTDRVVDSVLDMVRASGREGVVAYVSDHGENLMDDDRRAILHVRPEPTLQEVKVPMLFWATPRAKSSQASRWALGASRTGDPVDARALVPSVGLLVGLKVPGLDTSLSPFSAGWERRERRILSSSETIYPEKDLR
jgi:glucan phosphoethanolaminetransferase (alkaline phosphatase superfamily)